MTGNTKVWRAPLAGLASVAMLATMGVAAGTASADPAAGVDPYDYTVTLHANTPKNVKNGASVTADGRTGSTVSVSGHWLDVYGTSDADSTLDRLYDAVSTTAPGGTATADQWKFTGWYTSPDYGSEKFDFTHATVTKNLDLYAHWAESDQEVNINFKTSGLYDLSKTVYYTNAANARSTFAKFSGTDYALTVAKQDKKIAAWELPGDKADGYVVDTWKVGPAGQIPTDTVTLKQLTEDFSGKLSYQNSGPYNVALEAVAPTAKNATRVQYWNAGHTSTYADFDVAYGEKIPTDVNLGDGSTLAGKWYYKDTKTGAWAQLPDGATANGDFGYPLELRAWAGSTASHTVTYWTEVAGSWTTVVGKEFVADGQSPKGVTPSRNADYTFLGWSTTPEYNAKTVDLGSLKINANTNLYAQWTTNKANVKFDYNYDGKIESQDYAAGENYSFTAPTAQRDGYQFLGWYYLKGTNGTTTSGNPFSGTSESDNAVFYKAFVAGTKTVGWAQTRNDATGRPTTSGAEWLEQYSYTDANGKTQQVRLANVFKGGNLVSIPAGARLSIDKLGKLHYQYTVKVPDPESPSGQKDVVSDTVVPSTLYAAWGKVTSKDLDNQVQVPGYTVTDSYEVKDTELWTADSVAKANEALKSYAQHKAQLEQNGLTDDEAATLSAELDKAQALLVQKATTPVTRLVRNGVHLYVTSNKELEVAQRTGWKVEGVAFYAASVAAPKSVAVHRLRNLSNGHYLNSSDPNEVSTLTAGGSWTDEGILFYAPQGASAPVYRFHKAEHLYTADENEYKVNTTKGGWSGDGVLLYAALAETK